MQILGLCYKRRCFGAIWRQGKPLNTSWFVCMLELTALPALYTGIGVKILCVLSLQCSVYLCTNVAQVRPFPNIIPDSNLSQNVLYMLQMCMLPNCFLSLTGLKWKISCIPLHSLWLKLFILLIFKDFQSSYCRAKGHVWDALCALLMCLLMLLFDICQFKIKHLFHYFVPVLSDMDAGKWTCKCSCYHGENS